MIELPRRKFLTGIAALIAAPAVVQPQNLMRVRGLILPITRKVGFDGLWEGAEFIFSGSRFLVTDLYPKSRSLAAVGIDIPGSHLTLHLW